MGTEYAALLVDGNYSPPSAADVLPSRGGQVIDVTTVSGTPSVLSEKLTPGKVDFSGFSWEVYRRPRTASA